MHFFSFMWIILITVILSIFYVNNQFEYFVLIIPKDMGIEKSEGCFRVMIYSIDGDENLINDIELNKMRLV